jgi:hypothetical protein
VILRFLKNLLLGFFLLMPFSGSLGAEDSVINFRGFGTIGVLTHDSEDLVFHRDSNKRHPVYDEDTDLSTLSNLGLQLDTSFAGPFDAAFQVVFTDGYEYNPASMIRLAAVTWEPVSYLQLRLGRVKPRFFLLTDTKLTGFSQLWTMPVHEFYGTNASEFVDGGELNLEAALGDGYLKFNFVYGEMRLDGKDNLGEESILKFSDYAEFNFVYELSDWTLRAGYTLAQITDVRNDSIEVIAQLRDLSLAWTEASVLANALDMENTKTENLSAGVSYNDGTWNIQSEIFHIWGESKLVPDIRSVYLSIGYQIDKFTPYLLLSDVRDKSEDVTIDYSAIPSLPFLPPQSVLQQTAAGVLLGVNERTDQTSVSLGLRYDLTSTSACKIQWDRKRIEKNGYGLWQPVSLPVVGAKTVNVISATYEFIF